MRYRLVVVTELYYYMVYHATTFRGRIAVSNCPLLLLRHFGLLVLYVSGILPSVLFSVNCRMECQQQQWWFYFKEGTQGRLNPSPGNPRNEFVHGMILVNCLLLSSLRTQCCMEEKAWIPMIHKLMQVIYPIQIGDEIN